VLAAGCGGRAAEPGEPAPRPSATNQADLEALYRARKDTAQARFTDADVRFMTGMITHHAQALIMSAMAPSHGASSSVQTLASRIINAQNDEIATMQRWLRDRGQPVPEVHIAGTEMMIHGGHGMEMMPGMLTPEQMRRLDEARGPEFDRLFLTYMVQHHSGALTMVKDLFAQPGGGEEDFAFKIASDIQADQTTEIARMQRMLSTLGSRDARP
jgi:uncharacterized protein (DUF305 family)